MGTDEDRANMGFQHRNGDNSMFKSSSGADHSFFGSGWDPLVSLSQSENFEGSSVIPHTFGVHYPSDSGLVDMVPKLPPCFGSGSFSEMVGSFGQPEYGQIARTEKTSTNGAPSQGDQQISEEGALGISHSGKRKKRVSESNSPFNPSKVRRERISERMKLLQELVPGCNKITGKAVMLDEIINYVQSLQQQVEFLSMKLATVNPQLNVDIDRIISKEILHLRGSGAAIPGFDPGSSSSHQYPLGIPQGTFPGIPSASPFHLMPQNVWDNDLQSFLQMGFDSNPAISNLEPNGRSKLER
ncbi:hypothetical protein ACSBR1_000699 [Camellia fascicularis]